MLGAQITQCARQWAYSPFPVSRAALHSMSLARNVVLQRSSISSQILQFWITAAPPFGFVPFCDLLACCSEAEGAGGANGVLPEAQSLIDQLRGGAPSDTFKVPLIQISVLSNK